MSKNLVYLISALLFFASCAPKRDLVYFSNMTNATTVSSAPEVQIIIQKNDILNVNVSSLNPETNKLFLGYRNENVDGSTKKEGYRVNSDGKIQLPIVGDFTIAGLTIEQAQKRLVEELSNTVKSPVVEIELLNFKVTVIGEVNRPGAFTVDNEQINLLEAIGLAGDLTPYGKRENILLIRNQDGNKTINRINLNDKNTLSLPYFNLKQNDIVYVEPDKSKAFEVSKNVRTIPMIIASISALAVVAAIFFRR